MTYILSLTHQLTPFNGNLRGTNLEYFWNIKNNFIILDAILLAIWKYSYDDLYWKWNSKQVPSKFFTCFIKKTISEGVLRGIWVDGIFWVRKWVQSYGCDNIRNDKTDQMQWCWKRPMISTHFLHLSNAVWVSDSISLGTTHIKGIWTLHRSLIGVYSTLVTTVHGYVMLFPWDLMTRKHLPHYRPFLMGMVRNLFPWGTHFHYFFCKKS